MTKRTYYEPDRWLMLASRLLVKQDELKELERTRRARVHSNTDRLSDSMNATPVDVGDE